MNLLIFLGWLTLFFIGLILSAWLIVLANHLFPFAGFLMWFTVSVILFYRYFKSVRKTTDSK